MPDDLVEPHLVALERGQGLVGPGQDRRGVLEDVAAAVDVQRDDLHRLADRDHRVARSAWRPARRCGAGCPTPRSGSSGRARAARCSAGCGWRRGPGSTAPSIFASSRSRVAENSHVEGEAAGADRLDGLVVAEHDQRAGASAQDALEPVAQGRAGRDGGERGPRAAPRPFSRRAGPLAPRATVRLPPRRAIEDRRESSAARRGSSASAAQRGRSSTSTRPHPVGRAARSPAAPGRG